MSRRVTLIAFTAIAVVALAAGAFLWQWSGGTAVVSSQIVDRRALTRHVQMAGTLLPEHYAVVLPKMPSRVADVFVREGQQVKRGQRVVALDASDLAVDVERKQIALLRTRLQRQRRTERVDTGADEMALLDLDVRSATLELKRAEGLFKDAVLTAPIAGTVVQVGARVGEMLSSNRNNLSDGVIIAGTTEYAVRGEIDEFEAHAVRAGATATVQFDALPGASMKGAVKAAPVLKRFRADARQATAFEVTVTLVGEIPRGLTAGHTGTVTIDVGGQEEHLVVPIAAVIYLDQASYVVKLARREWSLARVTLGNDDGRDVEILDGLHEGDVIATGDTSALVRRLRPE